VNPVILYRNLAGTGTNTPPTVSVAASATPAAVPLDDSPCRTGADDGGEAALSYTWPPPPAPRRGRGWLLAQRQQCGKQ